MKKKLLSVVLGLAVVSSLVLTACGNSSDNSVKESNNVENGNSAEVDNVADAENLSDDSLNQATSITIGVIGNTNLIVNTDRLYGFVQKEVGDDVEVSYEVFHSGAEALTALQSGSVDVMSGNGALPIVTFGANNSEFVIISSYATQGDSYIAARPDIGVESLEDLKGKQIGVPLGTGSHYLLLKKLEEVGLTAADVELVNLSGPDLMTAYAAGEIDVFVNSVQLTEALISSGEAIKIGESDAGYYYLEANKDYATENPEVVEKFVLGLHNASAYLKENTDDVIAEIAEKYELEANTLKLLNNSFLDTTFFLDVEEPKKQVEEYKQFALDNELIATDFDIEPYFDFSFSENAQKASAK